MNLDLSEIEQNARKMRADAVSLWMSQIPARLRIKWHAFASFINAFRAFPGIRA
jgi:hypothetical protein